MHQWHRIHTDQQSQLSTRHRNARRFPARLATFGFAWLLRQFCICSTSLWLSVWTVCVHTSIELLHHQPHLFTLLFVKFFIAYYI